MLKQIRRAMQRRRQSGSALVAAALSVSALLFTGALVTDVGGYYAMRSSRQNAADAAAIAGASAYMDTYVNHANIRLVPLSEITEDGDDIRITLQDEISGNTHEYTLVSDDVLISADDRASASMMGNIGRELAEESGSDQSRVWWAPADPNQSVNGDTPSYTDIYCYRVDLEDDVPMTFAKFFGIDSWKLNTTALALVLPTKETEPDDDNIDELIKKVNADIYKTVPNYYWESIHDSSSSFTVAGDTTSTLYGWGDKKIEYFTTSYDTYSAGITENVRLASDSSLDSAFLACYNGDDPSLFGTGGTYNFKGYSTYYRPELNQLDLTRYIARADDIHGTDRDHDAGTSRDTDTYPRSLQEIVYTIDKKLIQNFTEGKEITGLFLDRPNTWSNKYIRAIALNITGETLGKSDEYNDTPLFIRVESEPIKVGGNRTLVQPLVVNCTGAQEKPMVIAYDGPDSNRGLSESEGGNGNYDNIRVDTTTGEVYLYLPASDGQERWVRAYSKYMDANTLGKDDSGYSYGLQFRWDGRVWEQQNYTGGSGYNNGAKTGKILEKDEFPLTSTTTSAPIYLNLTADFNGVLYAPCSKVIISGPGKIKGFVMAAQIEDFGSSTDRTRLSSHKVTLPTWGASYQSGSTTRFNYTVKQISSYYTVVYDTFLNYTLDLGEKS